MCGSTWCITPLQTEDQLTRDMLAGTAGFINCVGGVNGKKISVRIIAVKKSSLIDLELPSGQQGGSVSTVND